jgi:hypothetical protein
MMRASDAAVIQINCVCGEVSAPVGVAGSPDGLRLCARGGA